LKLQGIFFHKFPGYTVSICRVTDPAIVRRQKANEFVVSLKLKRINYTARLRRIYFTMLHYLNKLLQYFAILVPHFQIINIKKIYDKKST